MPSNTQAQASRTTTPTRSRTKRTLRPDSNTRQATAVDPMIDEIPSINHPTNVPISIRPPFFTTTEVRDQLPLKSTQGRRCLTKCYPKGLAWLHPLLLTPITRHYDSCAIDPVQTRDEKLARSWDVSWDDPCLLVDNYKYQEPDELANTLLQFYFNPNDLLTTIYDINTFDDAIYWTLENDHLPIDTIRRVHNCAWKAFGDNPANISNAVIDYYFDIAHNHWLKEYAHKIETDYSFNLIDGSQTVALELKDQVSSTDMLYNLLDTQYFTMDFFTKAIKQFARDYAQYIDNLESPYDMLKKYVLDSLVEIITSTTRGK